MESKISLKIDLRSGVIEIDSPAESFSEAIAQTKELTSTLDFSTMIEPAANPSEESPAPVPRTEPLSPAKQATNVRRAKASKASSARPGRIGSFEEVKGLLSEPQEIELRQFYAAKAPTDQGHQVVVAIVKGEELLNRRGFSYNEIYTLMWLGGVKDLPKAIDVVLSRLVQEQMVVREDSGFAAKFVGRNFVNQDLPKSA